VQEETDVKDRGDDQAQGSDDPDDQGKQHSEVYDSFLLVSLLNHDFDVDEELLKP
jgi:hypothetical protein